MHFFTHLHSAFADYPQCSALRSTQLLSRPQLVRDQGCRSLALVVSKVVEMKPSINVRVLYLSANAFQESMVPSAFLIVLNAVGLLLVFVLSVYGSCCCGLSQAPSQCVVWFLSLMFSWIGLFVPGLLICIVAGTIKCNASPLTYADPASNRYKSRYVFQ